MRHTTLGNPIPGTRHVARVEANVTAESIQLAPSQLERLAGIRPPVGDRYADMAPVIR
jgi:aryl-alcohol dehydrogenase-like predicted oxidoreductase